MWCDGLLCSQITASNLLSFFYNKSKILLLIRSKKDINIFKKKYPKLKCIYFNSYRKLDSELKKIKVDIVLHAATHYVKNHSKDDIEKFASSNIIFGNIIKSKPVLMIKKDLLRTF